LLATIGSLRGQHATHDARQTLSAHLDAPLPASDAALMTKYPSTSCRFPALCGMLSQ
jgi:hypothetical protein